MFRFNLISVLRCTFVLLAITVFSVSAADAEILSSTLLELEAANDVGVATFAVDLNEGEQSGDVWRWALEEPVELRSEDNEVVASLSSASLTYIEDPQIGLNFSVMAGSSDTMFTLTSALLAFPVLNPAEGRASAGISVTDGNGNGATLSGNVSAGGKSYLAVYNGGSIFADLVDDDSIGDAFGTFTSSEASPASGFSAIAGGVSSMQTEFSFTLNAGDSASGTSIFVVRVPEPSSMALILCSFAMLCGRRWR